MELKSLIFDKLKEIDILQGVENLYDLLTYSPDAKNGDVTLPCFVLAKALHRSPIEIGDNIVSLFNDDIVDKAENVKGYVNFYFNKRKVFEMLYNDLQKSEPNKIGAGKNVFIDFCSVNLAKYMHIGSLK